MDTPPDARKPVLALAVLALAQFTVTLEFSVVYVAMPRIASDLDMGVASVQWLASAYAVFLASWLVVAGRVADRVGAGRVFTWSVAAFSGASVIAATAGSGEMLLAARAAQGAAAAFLQPAALGLVQSIHPGPRHRARAFVVWSAAGALGLAAGGVVGGVLTLVSWRLAFAINVPLLLPCLLGAASVQRYRPGAAPDSRTTAPVLSAALATAAVLAAVSGLTVAAGVGWSDPRVVGALAGALVLLAGFLARESRSDAVLIERGLRRSAALRLGSVATGLYMASLGSTYFLLTLLLQSVRSYTPLQAGVAFLPLTLLVAGGGPVAGVLLVRRSSSSVLGAGFTIGACGLVAVAATRELPYWAMIPGLALTGLGNGMVFTSMFVLGTEGVAAGMRASAGALLTTSQYVASAVALAFLTLLLGTRVTSRIGVAFVATAIVAAVGAALFARPRTPDGSRRRNRAGADDAVVPPR